MFPSTRNTGPLKMLPLQPGDLPDPGIEPACPTFAGGFFTTEPPGEPHLRG